MIYQETSYCEFFSPYQWLKCSVHQVVCSPFPFLFWFGLDVTHVARYGVSFYHSIIPARCAYSSIRSCRTNYLKHDVHIRSKSFFLFFWSWHGKNDKIQLCPNFFIFNFGAVYILQCTDTVNNNICNTTTWICNVTSVKSRDLQMYMHTFLAKPCSHVSLIWKLTRNYKHPYIYS